MVPTDEDRARRLSVSAVMAQTTAIVGGTLVDVRKGKTTANTTVLVDGDRIADVGSSDRVRAPAGAKEVDARGGWLIPGLTDMHAHLRAPALLPVYLA